MTDRLLFIFAGIGFCFAARAWFGYHAAVKAEKLQLLWNEIEGWR